MVRRKAVQARSGANAAIRWTGLYNAFDLLMEDQSSETTQLLRAWAGGDRGALEELTPRVYRTLKRIAGHQLRNERAGQTLQATALVHEAYLELIDIRNVDWQHRAHFFAVSAEIMRHILLDRARRRLTAKRGGSA